MTVRQMTQAERRELIRKLILSDPQRSARSIGRAVGCSHVTVLHVRQDLVQVGEVDRATNRQNLVTQAHGGQLARTPRGGLSPALKHGCDSPSRLAPVRERHARELRIDYPWIDGRQLALVSDLCAKVELGSRWADEHGIVSNRHGRVPPIIDRHEAWSKRLSDELTKLEAKHRERAKVDPGKRRNDYLAALDAEVKSDGARQRAERDENS